MARKTPARVVGEEHEHYPRVVLRWDYPNGKATRIIASRCNLQWIIQRRLAGRGGKPAWRNRHFCRTRLALECHLDIHADEITEKLPEWYPEEAVVKRPA